MGLPMAGQSIGAFGGGPSAAVSRAAQPAPQPEITTQPAVELPPVDSAAVTALGQIIAAFATTATPAEKRQVTMVEACQKALEAKAAVNTVTEEVMAKIMNLVNALQQRNYIGASAVQNDLVNNHWKEHNDWIKGIKVLLPMLKKRG